MFFGGAAVGWQADDVAEVADIARQVAPTGIDLHGATREHVGGDFLEADGVHPAPAGQRLILTHIVACLAEEPPDLPGGTDDLRSEASMRGQGHARAVGVSADALHDLGQQG